MSVSAAIVAAILTLPTNAAVKFHSNSVKYKDSGLKPATGRSGSATLQARALVGKDQQIALELTTGSFDPAQSRGNIDKVQLKAKSIGTINDNHLSNDGTYTVMLTHAGRGETINITAHVSGIDGRRTDVVSVSEVAKLRPDLKVTSLSVPPDVVVGSPTMINATIVELNGETGARATCALRVDGTTVDSASNIWVDAGGVVSCSFLHTFQTAGSARVEVALRNVEPGDYDIVNNTLTKLTNVIAPTQRMARWSGGASEAETHSYSHYQSTWGYHSIFKSDGWQNDSSFSAIWEENLDLSTLRASYVEKTDNITLVELRNMPLRRDDSVFMGHGAGQCMVGITEAISAVICQRGAIDDPYMPRPKYINPMFSRRAGDVTYLSREWGKPTPESPDGDYVKNDSGRDTYGNQTRLGATGSIQVEISDATHRYAEHPTYTFESRTQTFEQPYQCYNSSCAANRRGPRCRSGAARRRPATNE
ncbi:MAG TPA: hypothetical protein VF787_28905 [Thermoanaerobaculia bacterium]